MMLSKNMYKFQAACDQMPVVRSSKKRKREKLERKYTKEFNSNERKIVLANIECNSMSECERHRTVAATFSLRYAPLSQLRIVNKPKIEHTHCVHLDRLELRMNIEKNTNKSESKRECPDVVMYISIPIFRLFYSHSVSLLSILVTCIRKMLCIKYGKAKNGCFFTSFK